jgi:hypothetical protein
MYSIVFVEPASFEVSGTGTVRQVAQQTVLARDADYTLFIEDASANDVFKAFDVSEGEANANASAEDIVVNAVSGNEGLVKDALNWILRYAITTSASGAEAADLSKNLIELMTKDIKDSAVATLTGNGLYDILEAEELLDVSIDVSGAIENGKDAMWDAMSAGTSAAARLLIAKQLPYENFLDISYGGNLDGAFKAGDSLTLYFNVNSHTFQITPVFEPTGEVGESLPLIPDVVVSRPTVVPQPTFPLTVAPAVQNTFNIVITKKAVVVG